MKERSVNLTISLPLNFLESLEAEAREKGISRSEWIRNAVSYCLLPQDPPIASCHPLGISGGPIANYRATPEQLDALMEEMGEPK
jgi:hypothetical protein